MVKNLRAYSNHCSSAPSAVRQELTRKEVKRLTATAKSAEDHLKIARYYEVEADRLDSLGAGYEEAAAGYRHNPPQRTLCRPPQQHVTNIWRKDFARKQNRIVHWRHHTSKLQRMPRRRQSDPRPAPV